MLLHVIAGSKEDDETVTAFFENMKLRGLNDPPLNDAPGIIKAIEVCFPRTSRQDCLAQRMRNLAAKLPEDVGQSSRFGRKRPTTPRVRVLTLMLAQDY